MINYYCQMTMVERHSINPHRRVDSVPSSHRYSKRKVTIRHSLDIVLPTSTPTTSSGSSIFVRRNGNDDDLRRICWSTNQQSTAAAATTTTTQRYGSVTLLASATGSTPAIRLEVRFFCLFRIFPILMFFFFHHRPKMIISTIRNYFNIQIRTKDYHHVMIRKADLNEFTHSLYNICIHIC